MASAPTVELFRSFVAHDDVPSYYLCVPREVIETVLHDPSPAITFVWKVEGVPGRATTTAPMFLQMLQVGSGGAFVEIDSLLVIHTEQKDPEWVMTVPETHVAEAASIGDCLPTHWWCVYFGSPRTHPGFNWRPVTAGSGMPAVHVNEYTWQASSQQYTGFLGGGRRWTQAPQVNATLSQPPRLLRRRARRTAEDTLAAQTVHKIALEGLGANITAVVSKHWPKALRAEARRRHRSQLLITLLNVSRSRRHHLTQLAFHLCKFLRGSLLQSVLMKEESRLLSYEERKKAAKRRGETFKETRPASPFGSHSVLERLLALSPNAGRVLFVLPPSQMQWMTETDHAHSSPFRARLNIVALVRGHMVVTARMVLSVAASISASVAIPDIDTDPVPLVASPRHALFNGVAARMLRAIQSWSGLHGSRNKKVRTLGIDLALGGDGTNPALPPCVRSLYRRCRNLMDMVKRGKTVTEAARRALRPKNNVRWIIRAVCEQLGLPLSFWDEFVDCAYTSPQERTNTKREYTGGKKTKYFIPSCRKLKFQHGFCPIKCDGVSLGAACLAAHEKYNPGVTAASATVPESVYRGTLLFHVAAGARARRPHVKLSYSQ